MADSWQQQVERIGTNLLTLEVNTAVKSGGISAQKLPELPMALHTLVDCYNGYLVRKKHAIDRQLLQLSASYLLAPDEAARTQLENWEPLGTPVPELTNGSETFEALVWAAATARRRGAIDPEEEWAPARIAANCRQLRVAAIMLEKQFPDGTTPYDDRLRNVKDGTIVPAGEPARLFGATIAQTAKALFTNPRPSLAVAPDLAVLIRKARDIGLEEVRFQTVLQLDGDVIVRVGRERDVAQRSYLGDLHREMVNDGIAQWRLLFEVVGDLVGAVGNLIFKSLRG